MDNMGAGGGGINGSPIFGSPEAGSPIMSPNGEVDNTWTKPEDNSVGEVYTPNAEVASELVESQGAANSEKKSEQQSSAMPMQPTVANQNSDELAVAEARSDLEGISVRRDSETLPKAYMQAVSKIINRDRKDPHRLVAELDVARWDMMSKAFGRKLGDGLNGRGINE